MSLFHCLKDNDRAIVKFSKSKDSLQVLSLKKEFKPLNPKFPEDMWIFINECLYAYYRGLWNKRK